MRQGSADALVFAVARVLEREEELRWIGPDFLPRP
jgi:hypothetical protein